MFNSARRYHWINGDETGKKLSGVMHRKISGGGHQVRKFNDGSAIIKYFDENWMVTETIIANNLQEYKRANNLDPMFGERIPIISIRFPRSFEPEAL